MTDRQTEITDSVIERQKKQTRVREKKNSDRQTGRNTDRESRESKKQKQTYRERIERCYILHL